MSEKEHLLRNNDLMANRTSVANIINEKNSEIVNLPFADEQSPKLKAHNHVETIIQVVNDDEEDDVMNSMENLAAASRYKQRKQSLSERRNLGNLYLKIGNNDANNDKIEPMSATTPDAESQDEPGPLVGASGGYQGRPLRRNSISLPSGLNEIALDALRQAHENAIATDDMNVSSPSIGDDSTSVNYSLGDPDTDARTPDTDVLPDTDDDDEPKASKFRTRRRASIAPLPSLRLNDKEMIANEFDSQSVISNQPSITSVSSLASLLKEKMQMFPAMIKKKKKTTNDFKIKTFVAILSLVIVFLIGYAYITYHQKVLARSFFEKIKLNKETRSIDVLNGRDQNVISGYLGTTILTEKPFKCLAENNFDDGSVCIEWNGNARLYLNIDESNDLIRCYDIRWIALRDGLYPTDCYDVVSRKEHWYGGGITKTFDFPMETANFDFDPFITGDATTQQWGNAQKRYFINSHGAAIIVNDKTPLYISMNYNNSEKFCLQSRNDNFAYVNRLTPRPELNYKICVGDDTKMLHQQMTQKSLWDGLKEKDISIVHSLLEEPVWQITASSVDKLTESTIYNYTEDVIGMGFLRLGHVLVNEFWQKHIGDFTLDEERFPTLEASVNVLHRRGFRIILSIQPFISTESPSFADAVAKKLLIYERLSERSIPALTRYKSVPSAGVLDVTNNASIPWILEKLEKVSKNYQIDGFFLDFGTAYNMPNYYQCSRTLINPDQYKTIFTSALEDEISIIGVSSAVSVPRPPAFISLPPVNSTWEGLQTVIKTVLAYGTIGYPFIMPGPVGGDYLFPSNFTRMLSHYSLELPPLPDQELYIRWLQLATFLPVLRFTHLPSEYKSEVVTDVVKELTGIRQKTVIPLLKKYLNDAMNEGLPLIRPLWMLDSLDAPCLEVNDEFSVGEELIVAPVLEKGNTQREVYLPQGVWKDGIDGSLRKGSRWIHNYRVPEDKVAYFVKMPDNTRF